MHITGQAWVIGDRQMLKWIRECFDKDTDIVQMLSMLHSLGPQALKWDIEEWNTEDGLILFCGKVYISKDSSICRDIMKIHHDSLVVEHPGR